MKRLKLYATSSTTLMFLVVGISGIMMFFKVFEGSVKELHEILGLVFVLAVVLHVVSNWTLMRRYFTNKIFISLAILAVLISGGFIVNASSKGGENPKMYIVKKVINMPLKDAIKVLDIDQKAVQNVSKKESLNIDISKSINQNAKDNKTSPFKIIAQMLP